MPVNANWLQLVRAMQWRQGTSGSQLAEASATMNFAEGADFLLALLAEALGIGGV